MVPALDPASVWGHQGPFGSFERQPGIHIEFETAVRVHIIPDQPFIDLAAQLLTVKISAEEDR